MPRTERSDGTTNGRATMTDVTEAAIDETEAIHGGLARRARASLGDQPGGAEGILSYRAHAAAR
jgi:hypothetical protein